MKLVRTVPVDALPFAEPKTGTELILNIGAAALHARKPDLSGCEVLTDGEGVALESNKPFGFTCCDCGLTHRFVIVSEDGKPVGFAVERDQEATAQRRAAPPGSTHPYDASRHPNGYWCPDCVGPASAAGVEGTDHQTFCTSEKAGK
jgi:hypothetical protein